MALRRTPEAADSFSRLPGLIQACPELRNASRIVVGYSGGLDSTVLLHLLHVARTQGLVAAPVHAVHVNHVLQTQADEWEAHCRAMCEALHIPFESVRAPVVVARGDSLEEAARNMRYAAYEALLGANEVLALAQHRDDQVETVLFRLLRGSGAAGLAGMPRSRQCGAGLLARPLLDARRAELLNYAQSHQLRWIEDGSNKDQRFDRNFLRDAVLPLLYRRWPGLAAAVARAAELSAEAALLLDELAAQDIAAAGAPGPTQFPIAALLPLSAVRQRNALRYWLQRVCTQRSWAMPTHQVLNRILTEVIGANDDAEPLLSWGEGSHAVELRRYRGLLHVLAPLPPMPAALQWSTSTSLELPAPLGVLEMHSTAGMGLPRERVQNLRVCFRSGGELVKAAGRPTRPLKKILQDAGVPSWLRERIPLLYAGDELVAVADLLVCDGWLTDSAENRCRIMWRHPDLDCGYPPHLLI